MKKIGVLFSGGLDSTYLIYKNLKEGNEVVPIYIEIGNNVFKSKLEKNRVGLLYSQFRKEYSYNIRSIENVLKFTVTGCNNLMFAQMPAWIFGLIYCQCLDVEEFQIGYTMNDDAISYLEEINEIYNGFKKISCSELKPLKFPLLKIHKCDMFRELPTNYREHIVSCENPHITNENKDIIEYKPCCECPACKRAISTYYSNYRYSNDVPDYYKEGILQSLVNDVIEFGKYKIFDSENKEVKYSDLYSPKLEEATQLRIKFPSDYEYSPEYLKTETI